MAKIPKPAPVLITKCDAHGVPVSTTVVTPKDEYRRQGDWEPEEVRLTMKVWAKYPDHPQVFVAHAHNGTVDKIMDDYLDKHPDCEEVWATPINGGK